MEPKTPEEIAKAAAEKEKQLEIARNRFNRGVYQFQGPAKSGPAWIVPQGPGNMTYPKSD